ncbi:MAG TPA: hypothetical protein VGU03_15535 [Frateuria sp.]|uniref:hypothetical protein n=1 Tax=Frateuria sp. TaxID=2211372 RepID=UPI002DF1F26F|nr:hypothetical protein [Frateuria sp.]
MPCITRVALATFFSLAGAAGVTRASEPGLLDDATLAAYAARPFDKRMMMGQTVELGRNHGLPVVAEFPCSDLCPQYTVRIIHYRLPTDADCAGAGGIQESVPVPVAIAALPRDFCVPKVLVGSGDYYRR